MTLITRDVLRAAFGDELGVIRTTSSHLAVNYPFQAESGIIDPRTKRKIIGLPVGTSGRDGDGGIFYFDPRELYKAGLSQDTNVLRVGRVGKWKSAGVKSEIYLGAIAGLNHLAMDPKGEYTALANIIEGSKILRFGSDTNLSINPLDPVLDVQTRDQLLEAMTLNGLRPRQLELNNYQEEALQCAMEEAIGVRNDAEDQGLVATLPDLVERLEEPSDYLVERLRLSRPEVESICNLLRLALRKYTEGKMAGPFSRPTTTGMFQPTSLLVCNCENLTSDLAASAMIVLNFLTQSYWGRSQSNLRFHKVFHDEAWDLTKFAGYIPSLVRAFKLGGTWGVTNNLIVHELANLYISGDDKNVDALIHDSSIAIIYQQSRDQIEPHMKALRLNHAEVNQIVSYEPGQAMYKIGDLPGLTVNHTVSGWPQLIDVVETRHALKGIDLP